MVAAPSQSSWFAVHCGIFLAILGLVAIGLPPLAWPWYLLLPLAVYGYLILLVPQLRRTVPTLSFGRVDRLGVLAAIALTVMTSAVLVAYQVLVRPDVSTLAAKIPVASFGNLILAGSCFSVANALLEELIFRGVLYEVVAAEWGVGFAIGVTAMLFGLGHLHGYPLGPLGATLASVYGVALGLLRWWARGMGLAIGSHVCADATIFCIMASAGAFGNVSV